MIWEKQRARIKMMVPDSTHEMIQKLQQETIEDLKQSNRDLDQFILHASHDLRSPLATILSILEVSKKETSQERLHQYLDLAIERTNHLNGLLNDLASITFNKEMAIQSELIDFQKEGDLVLKEYRPLNTSIHYSMEVVQPDSFKSDVRRFRFILQNLISNSVKYSDPTKELSLIKLFITVDSEQAMIQVTDNGIGINPEHIDQIFTMFYRATNRSTGSGLGLYIIKTMVDKLDGKITVASLPSAGTSFTVILPNRKG
jgi:signal transduction histidine kinase